MLTVIYYGGLILALIGALAALKQGSWKWMLIGLIGSLPSVLYLSATPRFTWYFLVLVFPVLAMWGIRQKRGRVVSVAVAASVLCWVAPYVILFV